jgi:predicted ATP-grasp superfamily ATP-dependent carboligase
MRVLVYEHLSAGPDEPSSLHVEGWAMLAAVLADLTRLPGVTPVALVAPDLVPAARALGAEVHPPQADLPTLAAGAFCTLVIAPECDGVLAGLCRRVEAHGGRLLGPAPAAVELCADKLALAAHLIRHGVSTPATAVFGKPASSFPLVCKPRDGAGSQATFLIRDERELADCLPRAAAEGWRGELVQQPFVPGCAASVAVLVGPAGPVALPAAEQRLSADGRFRYLGGRVPLPADLDARARALALRAAAAVPGLAGYIGIDLVLGAEPDQDAVIEINPRLTTSYVGLRALADFNLAAALLAVWRGDPLPAWEWRAGVVEWDAAGRVWPGG